MNVKFLFFTVSFVFRFVRKACRIRDARNIGNCCMKNLHKECKVATNEDKVCFVFHQQREGNSSLRTNQFIYVM